MAAPKNMTAEQRVERARNAGKHAQSPETHAQKIARDWPELTPEQKSTIRTLLRPVVAGKTP